MKKVLLTALCFFLLTEITEAQNDSPQFYDSIRDAVLQAGRLSGDTGPANVIWIEDGERFSYMGINDETGAREIRVYNPADGSEEVIFDGQNLTYPDSDTPFTYSTFQWSDDFRFLVFQSDPEPVYRYSAISDYYLYSLEDGTLELIAERAFTAELSPDGSYAGIGRDGNLFVYHLETGVERQLTFNDEENVFYGRFGWVYEEEFGLVQAWSWSHDSSYIAFWKSDEREVPIFRTTDFEGTHPDWFEIPFPKVGDTNPSVKIGVVDISSGDKIWMDLDVGEGYIPRIYWTSDPGKLAVTEFNRPQTHLKIHMFDIYTGEGETITEESQDAWIDVFDFFAGIDHYLFFPEDREEFFWISDRSGFKHLYRFDYDGNLINQVTDGEWEVTYLHAVNSDEEAIYFTSTKVSPLERHLYRIGFDGSGMEKLTEETGRHHIKMGPSGEFYIGRYSNVETPNHVALYSTKTGLKEVWADNAAVLNFKERYAYSPRELFSFPTDDGTQIDAYMIRPPDFDESKSYPLLVSIYGGPGAQGVYNQFETSGVNQYLAQQGYVIVNVNNRGSGNYGRDFMKQVYKNLGHLEAADFAAVATWMADEYDWIEGDRMAIYGHSYGGYMAGMTAGLHPDVFKAAIIAAPVTDWRLYDTIYTERYMGLLEDNLEGYMNSSVMAYAQDISAELLIVHSAMDENVHLQNTMQLVTALTDAGKDADLRVYPPGNHSVAYDLTSYLLLQQTYLNFLNRHLME